jgi:glycyl-tRNA synthetase
MNINSIISMEATIPLTIDEIKTHLIETKYVFQTAQTYQSCETSTKGFQTYGPHGVILRNKVINVWKELFLTQNVHEIDTPILQSKEILTNSGHVGRFNDLIISNGSSAVFRADHLVKEYADTNRIKLSKPVDDFTKDELLEFVKMYKVVENSENATISPKNLMFSCGNLYLRPEIAQGMFTEFDQLYEHMYDLPFGIAQVGKSYRNEISCQPFIRLKEFTQAEVEYFFDPNETNHPYFDSVSSFMLPLYTQDLQLSGAENSIEMNLKEAVEMNVIVNEIMAYFLGTIYKFATTVGISRENIRFRQHLPNELSHYAKQCWDLEIKLVNGQWLECVGCAHRGDYDLTNHNIKKQNFIKKYSTKQTKYKVSLDKGIEKTLTKDEIKQFYLHFKGLLFDSEEAVYLDYESQKYVGGLIISSTQEIVESTVIPYVIEPSVGIDRMIFAIANNLLRKRECDKNRILFNLSTPFAPFHIGIYALSRNDELINFIKKQDQLVMISASYKVFFDFSRTSIGKRYVRADEIGIPFVITVDFESLKDHTVTIRSAKDGSQVRYSIYDLHCELPRIFGYVKNNIFD